MIKFFRHIRKQLLSENKIGKYFKYAIGEILLVVIGILIALQINTWNQNRLNKKEAILITESIYNDLVKDTLLLTKRINDYEDLLKHNSSLTDQLHSDTSTLNTFKNVAKEFNPTFWVIEAFNNTTLNSIESTGKIELLNNDFKKELMEHKSLQAGSLNKGNSGIYLGFMNNFTSKYKFGKNHGAFITKMNAQIKDEQEYVNLLTHLVGYKNYMMNSSLSGWKATKKKAKKILSMIEINDHD